MLMRVISFQVQGEKNCIFPEDPGQLLNDNCLKPKRRSGSGFRNKPNKDLKSRGLCFVPVSCTLQLQVGSDNGADYWAPTLGGGFR
ncbi:Transcription factor bhlh [Thalictrum thalictroides]|uniref:Transcription factor bhlh n=1 Tax=Thalictrum thalictroides TaxID=46969 RepID=A0A7J6WY60_THATH|nr:Transcription factor bhlh [Thalictrum thalictroides]